MDDTPDGFVAVTFSPQSLVAYFLKGVLECAGLMVTSATSSVEALESCVLRRRPDAIVYDVSFPFATNWRTLQEVRGLSAFRNVPVVVTTSDARELFKATGCSKAIEIVVRPENIVALRQALRGAIEAAVPGRAA
jgi:CheY-like chemotaxis protein